MDTLIASGHAPDIVGPVGVQGSEFYAGQWLDLTSEIAKNNYNTAQFPPAVMKIYTEGSNQFGLPFAVYPGVIYYNKDLFDAAGLKYPPAKFGDKYSLNGKDVDWDFDTVATIAKMLTVDANGKDATDADFDPTKIVQFGYDNTFDTMRADMETFGGGPVVDANGKVDINAAWRAEVHWQWDAMWKDHFMPNTTYGNSDLLKPNTFGSGKLAMTRAPLWFNCCAESADKPIKYDLAPEPSYNGTVYAPADADTFRIYGKTANPDAAFTVLSYLLGDAAPKLLTVYGAFPARPDLQQSFIDNLAKAHPSVTNWAIVKPSFDYAPTPHHESPYPNYSKGQDRFAQFLTALKADDAKSMDVDKALDTLQSDLQTLVDQAGGAAPAATMAATAAQ